MKDDRRVSEKQHKAEVGRRLRAAIEALGLTQTEVAHVLGVTPSKLGNWLRGDNYPAAWPMKLFCDRYGISADWIYRGIVAGMAKDLADKLWPSEQVALPREAEVQRAAREPHRSPVTAKSVAEVERGTANQLRKRRSPLMALP